MRLRHNDAAMTPVTTEDERGVNDAPFHEGLQLGTIRTYVISHLLVHSLVRLHRSFVYLLHTDRFDRALRCAHSFARSLTRLLPSSLESAIFVIPNSGHSAPQCMRACMRASVITIALARMKSEMAFLCLRERGESDLTERANDIKSSVNMEKMTALTMTERDEFATQLRGS